MIGRYKTICLTASSEHQDMFNEATKQLTLHKCLVLSACSILTNSDVQTVQTMQQTLDDMRLRKIDVADALLVVDTHQLGVDENFESTQNMRQDINYAMQLGKQVFWLHSIKDWSEVAVIDNRLPAQNCKFCWYNGIGGDKCGECTNFDKFEWSCKFCKHRKDDSLEPECDIAFEAGYKDAGSCIEIDVNCIEIDVNSIPTAQQELERYPNPEYQ